jgi:hypothetical protein
MPVGGDSSEVEHQNVILNVVGSSPSPRSTALFVTSTDPECRRKPNHEARIGAYDNLRVERLSNERTS